MQINLTSEFTAYPGSASTATIEVSTIVQSELEIAAAVGPVSGKVTLNLPTKYQDSNGDYQDLTLDQIACVSVFSTRGLVYSYDEESNRGSYVTIRSGSKTTGRIPFTCPIELHATSVPSLSSLFSTEVPSSILVENAVEAVDHITTIIGIV